MINLISKFNNYFILITFLIAVIAVQFGFINTSSVLFLSSINLFLILSILVCVSTKNINKIFLPVLVLAFLNSIYSTNNIFVILFYYITWAIIVFYLNKGPFFITDHYRFFVLIFVSIFLFKAISILYIFIFNYLYYHKIAVPNMDISLLYSIFFEMIYSALILFIFKPDVKYINYEFLVGD